ncbi:hypothetical protein GCM10011444_14940 [Winogradskyella haliclonae]|uniref:Uncharacterized protein n=1 Tax=Winogradskyella haliclonae TaxID=2048558 RepID=A0ABQ2BZ26_9FLAO|nr:hypothetical protein GCM10011444_14940 [Winogradskyella haliclonae]
MILKKIERVSCKSLFSWRVGLSGLTLNKLQKIMIGFGVIKFMNKTIVSVDNFYVRFCLKKLLLF